MVAQVVGGLCAAWTYTVMKSGRTFPLKPDASTWSEALAAELVFNLFSPSWYCPWQHTRNRFLNISVTRSAVHNRRGPCDRQGVGRLIEPGRVHRKFKLSRYRRWQRLALLSLLVG